MTPSRCCIQYVSKSGRPSSGHGTGKGQSLSEFPKRVALKNVLSIRQSHSSPMPVSSVQFSRSVGSNSATPWTAACQASLSITNSWSLLKLMSIELVTPSNHLILCRPLLLLPSIFLSIRVFTNVNSSHQVAKVLGV